MTPDPGRMEKGHQFPTVSGPVKTCTGCGCKIQIFIGDDLPSQDWLENQGLGRTCEEAIAHAVMVT